MTTRNVLLLCAMLILSSCALAQYSLTVRVVGENGEPIEGADVLGIFEGPGLRGNSQTRQTDAEGWVTVRGNYKLAVRYEAEKDGYYTSKKRVGFGSERRYEDEIVLREIVDPIPMVVNTARLFLDEAERYYGYDLLVGDFVESGSGVVSDIYIMGYLDMQDRDNRLYRLEIHLRGGEFDGFQKADYPREWVHSDFKSHHSVPDSDFEREIRIVRDRTTDARYTVNENTRVDTQYYLRTRTEVNDEGDIESAYYCKIFPGFSTIGAMAETVEAGGIEFTYYCNPNENDRNMEHDRSRNLTPG